MKNLIKSPLILEFIKKTNPSVLLIQVPDNISWSEQNLFLHTAYEQTIQSLYTPNVTTFENVWEFVEENYHGYSSADEILENDDLTKITQGEADDEIICSFLENYQVDLTFASEYKIASDVSIYEKAIKDYIYKKMKK